jgi:putative Mn2+ efflux pump MntP
MDLFSLFGIALALAVDAFTVAVALSLRPSGLTPRQSLRIAFHFGLFQALMPILGWLAGTQILGIIRAVDHWIAFALLGLVGGRMIYQSLRPGDGASADSRDPTRGWGLVVLSLAVSIDALAVGLSLAALETGILGPAALFGLVAALLSGAGARIGRAAGRLLGRWAELAGGVVLILIGIHVLVEHLT